MKVNTFEYPKSSFLGMTKDTSMIMKHLLSNKRILKLLYYNTPDSLRRPDITGEQERSLLDNKQISLLPQLTVDKEKLTYLRLYFDNFTPSRDNTFYRDHIVEVRIISHFDIWQLEDLDLRPYRLAGEIDSMLDGARLSGIGKFLFVGANQDVYDREFGGITLQYLAVRGHEDDINPLRK